MSVSESVGISPFGGELELEEGGFGCIDEDFDAESDEAIIAKLAILHLVIVFHDEQS